MLARVTALAASAVIATTYAAQAAPIDLSSLADTSGASLSTPDVTLSTSANGALITVAQFDALGTQVFCAVASSCANDFTIEFATPSSNVSISIGDTLPSSQITPTEIVVISAFDAMDALLSTTTVETSDFFPANPVQGDIYTATVFLGNVSGVTRVEIDDQNTDATGGYFYFNIDATPIPLPAALPLMALGLGALGVARSRKRKAA